MKKVTLDLDHLLKEGSINQEEYDRLLSLSAKSTSTLAFNLLIGFGVIAVSGSALALAPTPTTSIIIGAVVLAAGIALLCNKSEQWKLLANILILVGALMSGGGIGAALQAHLFSFLLISLLYALSALLSKSSLLAVLSTLALSGSIGASTGYRHASYSIMIKEPVLTVALFSVLAILMYQLSKIVGVEFSRLSIASARTSVFLVNFGFWIGSLWGDKIHPVGMNISATAFSVLWAVCLILTAIWSWKANRRWVLNTVATFGAIHFYTQLFESLGASRTTVLIAGLLALAFALGLKEANKTLVKNTPPESA